MKFFEKKIKAGILVLTIGAMAGCATVKPEPPELVVRKLATQRWQALLAGEFDKAYALATPGYRQIYDAEAYRKQRQAPVKWLAAEVYSVKCQEVKCQVTVRLQSKPVVPVMRGIVLDSGIDETWVQEGGQWWMLEPL